MQNIRLYISSFLSEDVTGVESFYYQKNIWKLDYLRSCCWIINSLLEFSSQSQISPPSFFPPRTYVPLTQMVHKFMHEIKMEKCVIGKPYSWNHTSGNQASGNHASGNHVTGNQISGNHPGGNYISGNHASGNHANGIHVRATTLVKTTLVTTILVKAM